MRSFFNLLGIIVFHKCPSFKVFIKNFKNTVTSVKIISYLEDVLLCHSEICCRQHFIPSINPLTLS